MSKMIKNELVKYVLEAEARTLNDEYENCIAYDDWAPADADERDKAYMRGKKDAINDAMGVLHKLAGLLS